MVFSDLSDLSTTTLLIIQTQLLGDGYGKEEMMIEVKAETFRIINFDLLWYVPCHQGFNLLNLPRTKNEKTLVL